MRRFNASFAAIGIALVALFTALGGPAWAAGLINGSQIKTGSITSKQIKNRSITSKKIGRGQVKAANLANGAVTASTVTPGSLTAADVASNTFLAANGTAADSNQLGGVAASDFVHGTGNTIQNRIEITEDTSDQFLLDTGLGEVDGSCLSGGKPEISFTAETQPLNLIEWGTTGATPDTNTANNLTTGA